MKGHLKNDPRVKKAKQLLQAALKDYQKDVTESRPRSKSKAAAFKKLLAKCGKLRGGNLFLEYLSTGAGNGSLVQLADGSVKYDFITGIGVHYMGHSHPKILNACVDAALEDTVMNGNLQQSTTTVELLDLFVKLACRRGAKLKNCFLTSSGAMANENAFKMIFQKHAPAKRFLAFKRCFAGRSMVMAQVTDKPANRIGLPKVMPIDYIPFYDPAHPKKSTKAAVAALKKHIKKHPRQHAGMIMELIQGEGGYYPGTNEFFMALIRILKKHNIAVMIDEIQTFARTREAFAFQRFKLDKYVDVVSVGKNTQVCATLFTDAYKPQPGLISQTFTSSSAAIHSAIVVLKEVLNGNLLGAKGKVVTMGNHFRKNLRTLSKKHPHLIRGPFGFEGMVAMSVLDGSKELSTAFIKELFHEGVLSFVAGKNPVRVRFLIPMMAVTKRDINAVSKILERTLLKMESRL